MPAFCGAVQTGGGPRPLRRGHPGAGVIDVHCHAATWECEPLVGDLYRSELEPYDHFLGAKSAAQNKSLFRIVRPYTLYVPLIGAQCALAVCSDKLDPKSFTADEIDRRIEQRRLQDLRFYNGETHEGVFALPNYVRELVNPPRAKLQLRSRRLGVVS